MSSRLILEWWNVEDAPHRDEYPDYRRSFRDGMKAAREEAARKEAAGD